MDDAFRINEPQVACEALEGDLILLNFSSGFYYNVRGIGADVCQHLFAGGALRTAIDAIASHFKVSPEQASDDVNAFVDELVREGLLMPSNAPVAECSIVFNAATYVRPRCEKFDDMADQLLLDKIDDQDQDAQWSISGV